jgi:protein-L-isoaspartate(D-aspartate) O-methyltransferase
MTVDLAAARKNMVDCQVRTQDVTDYAILDAMRAIAREAFMPPDKAYMAYSETEIEYAPGRWLLRPRDVAKLLQAVRPRPGEKAAAIAAPYAGAVLEAIGLIVTPLSAIDRNGEIAQAEGGYDVMICEGAVARAPRSWLAALAVGGRLGLVERDGSVGRATLYLRSEAATGSRVLFDSTPPVLAGFEAQHGFAL